MIRLSAFADEISPDLNEQIAVLQGEHIHYIDLRGIWGTNVLDLSDEQVRQSKQMLDEHGIKVAAIASPLGKVPIDTPFEEYLKRVERAIELAHAYQSSFIRIFSFYPPAADRTQAPEAWREEVIRRLKEMTRRAAEANVILLHENEKEIYGDTIARCIDLHQQIIDPHFRAAFDTANFIQCQQTPYPDGYDALRPWITYVHVKDALANGSVVPAGEGLSHWPDLLQRLRQDGYDGFFALEPHLASAERYRGFSGPELFRRASQAFQRFLQQMSWEYA
jgi:3-dehydroshikimate dehydratase